MADEEETKVRKVRTVVPATPVDSQRLAALKLIAGESKDIPLMSTELQPIRCVRTISPSLNRAFVMGGAPVRATYVIHGPPAAGKTAVAALLIRSFMERGHYAGFIDAEHAVSKVWFMQLGIDPDSLLFKQPDSFEEAVALADKWIFNFRKAKIDGKIPQDACFIFVVDTIHKLAPKKEMAKLLALDPSENKSEKKVSENIDKGWGRYRANLISVWIDKMTPIVGKNDVAFVALAHEHDNPNKDDWGQPDYKVKGGVSLLFEAMVRIRVVSGGPLLLQRSDSTKFEAGHISRITVEKNKVGFPHETCKMFVSNGKSGTPIGFDFPRDAFTEGLDRGVIEKAGAWYTLPGGGRGQGEEKTIALLRDNPDEYQALYDALLIKENVPECT